MGTNYFEVIEIILDSDNFKKMCSLIEKQFYLSDLNSQSKGDFSVVIDSCLARNQV